MKQNILFVSALADNGQIEVISAELNGQLSYRYNGTCDFYNYLKSARWRKKLIVLDGRDIPITLTPETHLIVNQIAEPDTHNKALQRLQSLLEQYPDIPVFNPPHLIQQTRRDRLCELLAGIEGLKVPRTRRIFPKHPQDIFNTIKKEGFQYPVIIKAAGLHGGQQTLLLKSADEAALYAVALDGRPYYLIQFVDTLNQNVYSKFRLVMVDGKFYPHHLRFSEDWLVHFYSAQKYMDKNPEYHDREKAFFHDFEQHLAPRIARSLKEIHRRIPLDFFGLDVCFLPDGQLLLFECNANMLILRNPAPKISYFTPAMERIHRATGTALDSKS